MYIFGEKKRNDFIKSLAKVIVVHRKNYDMWVIKMKMMLKVHDVWDYIGIGFLGP